MKAMTKTALVALLLACSACGGSSEPKSNTVVEVMEVPKDVIATINSSLQTSSSANDMAEPIAIEGVKMEVSDVTEPTAI